MQLLVLGVLVNQRNLIFINFKIIDFTICFAVASLFVAGNGIQFSKILYYRDSFVYILTVVILIIFLLDNKIEFYEAVILVCLWPLYLILNCLFFNKNEKSELNEDSKFESKIEEEKQIQNDNENLMKK